MLTKILEPNEPINETHVSTFGARYNLDLPAIYKSFLLKNNGGQPLPAAFPIEGFPGNPHGKIQAFFGLGANLPVEDLDRIMTDLCDRVPEGILPIAYTEGDDFVCLDLRKRGQPVIFWDRKPFWGDNIWNEEDIYLIAENFGALLEKLHEP